MLRIFHHQTQGESMKNFLVLLLISFLLLGCAPEGKHNTSDGDGSEETTTTPPEKEVSEEEKINTRIEKNISDFFNIPLKLGDSFTCVSGKCQKSNKQECSYSTKNKTLWTGEVKKSLYELILSPPKKPSPSTPKCRFTMTDLEEAEDIGGPGQQWVPQKLLIMCSNSKYNFPVETRKIGPKIFYVFKDSIYLAFAYTWNVVSLEYDQLGTAPSDHKIINKRFNCL
jgi:hypothetical protein